MPAELRIMTWNVQNLGKTKIGFPDIMQSIARVVTENGIDLFILLEVNTNQEPTAGRIAEVMKANLQACSPGQWGTCAMSPNTGMEFYGFFIRDTAKLQPITNDPGNPAAPKTLNVPGNPATSVPAQPYATVAGAAPCVFPLVQPNLVAPNQHHVRNWTGTRLPCLGLFGVAGTAQRLAVLAGHFAANDAQASDQVAALACIDVVDGICNAPPAFELTIDGHPRAVETMVITGDFNVDFEPADYAGDPGAIAQCAEWRPVVAPPAHGSAAAAPDSDDEWRDAGGEDDSSDSDYAGTSAPPASTSAAAPAVAPPAQGKKRVRVYRTFVEGKKPRTSLGLKAVITRPTLLAPAQGGRERAGGTADLAVRCIDNFFVSRALAVSEAGVVDVPAALRRDQDPLRLSQSVAEYGEYGMKNLSDANDYAQPVADYVTQLLNGGVAVSLGAARTGARLISDHLPIVMKITLP